MISFVDVFLRNTSARTVLIIVPVNTLQNWLAEFNQWLPKPEDVPEDVSEEEIFPRKFGLYLLNDNCKTTQSRAKVVGKLEHLNSLYKLQRIPSLCTCHWKQYGSGE